MAGSVLVLTLSGIIFGFWNLYLKLIADFMAVDAKELYLSLLAMEFDPLEVDWTFSETYRHKLDISVSSLVPILEIYMELLLLVEIEGADWLSGDVPICRLPVLLVKLQFVDKLLGVHHVLEAV